MSRSDDDVTIRSLTELDIEAISRIDEKVSGLYRPDDWETRVGYYLRRDPEAQQVAEIKGEVVGFMLGEVRSGEFGLEEPTGWIEVLGVDQDQRRKSIGRHLAEAILEAFKERGAKTVRTLVDPEMSGLGGFFESLGFETARLRSYIKKL